MKGGFIHECVLLDKVESRFAEQGFQAERQVATHRGQGAGYADLVINLGSSKLVIEAELSAKRIRNDLKKARALKAQGLWIVVPNRKVASSVRKHLRKLNVREIDPWLCVLTLGQALERARNVFWSFYSSDDHERKEKISPNNAP